jgi:hypothetical protein
MDTLKVNMIAALEKSMGIVTSACKKAKIARSTHYGWMTDDPEYKAAVDALSDVALDFAESKLMQSINNGSDTATIFYLKTKGKKRGYIERSEVTGADGKDLVAPQQLTKEQIDKLIDKL